MKEIIEQLEKNESLSEQQACHVLTEIFKGHQSSEDVYNYIKSLEEKGESDTEIIGSVQAMKANCRPIAFTGRGPLIDICGTGGSGQDRFNVSTCVAFVLAAAGVNVAKHGNYGSSKPNGSFNFLEEMNIEFQLEIPVIEQLFKKTKLCFLFARLFHPHMRYVAAARKKLNKRTLFNLIGPLSNPMPVTHQLIGLSSETQLPQLIKAVQGLGLKKVLFCIGGDKRDEISLSGISQLITVTPKKVTKSTLNFEKDIEPIKTPYLCGDSKKNAEIFTQLLIYKQWESPIIKHIAINAGAALWLVNKAKTIKEGYEQALNLFETEAVTEKINHYKEICVKLSLKK